MQAGRPDSASVDGGRVRDECADWVADVVSDLSYDIDALSGGVGELPVFVALAGEVEANVAAPMNMMKAGAPLGAAALAAGAAGYTPVTLAAAAVLVIFAAVLIVASRR